MSGEQSLPSIRKKTRNQEIFVDIASGVAKEEVCKKWHLSLTQLNRILRESREEAEEWYKSLPRQTMIQIFRYNCEKIFCELNRLEEIRNNVAKKDSKLEFEISYDRRYDIVEIVPSTNQSRAITKDQFYKVWSMAKKITTPFKTTHYHNVTYNSSYIVAIMKYFLKGDAPQ